MAMQSIWENPRKFRRIQVQPLNGTIGAEIRGVDLKGEVPDAVIADIRRLLLRYKVVFFHQQHLDADRHRAFARRFGELTSAHPVIPGLKGYPEVFEIDYTKTRKVYATYGDLSRRDAQGVYWHTDVTFVKRPPLGSILNAVVIPPSGGDTQFANMYLAYEALSEPIKRLCEGLTAKHTSAHVYADSAYGRSDKKFPEAVHPVVRTHPVTGRKALFVNRGFTTRIMELRKAESDALLELLLRHAETPEFQCRFRWQRHSVAFWDNRCALHRATFDYHPAVRHGHRVTIRGDKPV